MRLAFFIILLAVVLSACDDQPPRAIAEVQASVKSRISYNDQNAYDIRYIPPGSYQSGNCATFAYTAMRELEARGYPAVWHSCTTRDTHRRHAYAQSGKWALDIRFIAPVPVDRVNCI